MSRAWKIAAFGAAASIAVYGGACGGSDTSGTKPAPEAKADPALADVRYEGDADAIALSAMVAVAPIQDPARGAVIDDPPPVTDFVKSKIATFRWHMPAAHSSLGVPALGPIEVPTGPSLRGALAELLGPERSASATSASMNGWGHFLVFSTAKNKKLVRVFTTETSYTPDADAWNALGAEMTWVTLDIVSASFERDRLVANEGPFEGASVEFCIEDDEK